ncbi:hypothetical protein BC828DRAFT_386655 [Blastocladiella britannica]|nr:hypothetical protein BC828DRAFT_386655 [Blastocladiella britannica]
MFSFLLGNGPSKTSYALMKGVQLLPIAYPKPEVVEAAAAEPTPVVSESLWKDQPALIVLIRRPGCLFCRNEAHMLAGAREEIAAKLGVRMVAIVNQSFGAQDFVDNFWKGEAYFDKDLGLFKAMGDGQIRKASLLQLGLPSVIARYQTAKQSGLDSNLKGDGTILGGLLLVKKGDDGIAYEHIETEFGDIAELDSVLGECRKVVEATA